MDRKEYSLVLYDHNAPVSELEAFSDRVVRIVDHHDDSHYSYTGQVDKDIRKIGSACSMVVEMMLASQRVSDPSLRLALSTVIRVDCFDFEESQ